MNEQLEAIGQVKSTVLDLAVRFGPRLLAAILILVAGILVSRWLGSGWSVAWRGLSSSRPFGYCWDALRARSCSRCS